MIDRTRTARFRPCSCLRADTNTSKVIRAEGEIASRSRSTFRLRYRRMSMTQWSSMSGKRRPTEHRIEVKLSEARAHTHQTGPMAKQSRRSKSTGEVSIECEGKTYVAFYTHDQRADWVHVSTGYGEKGAKAGASGPVLIAQILLREILDDAKRRGDLR